MKLAAIHCRIAPGGALEVFKDLIKEEIETTNFSDIKIFTIYSELEKLKIGDNEFSIITALPKRLNTFFQRNTSKKLPVLGQIFDYRNLMFFYPLIMKILSWKIEKYQANTILISSFAVAKNIEQCKTTSPSKKNIKLYLHSPMQYIRSHSNEYEKKLKGRKGILFKRIAPRLRKRDLKYKSHTIAYSNSNYTKELAKKIYDFDTQVKYPLVNKNFFKESIIETPDNYYICIGRVVKFVREIDIIIKLFNELNIPLIIIGSGPDEKELKKIANKNISFTGRNPPNMTDIIKHAKGAINLTKESFGLSTAECLCLGIPVLGYAEGASSELINEESGILAKNKSIEELKKQFKIFSTKERKRTKISQRARQLFSQK